MIQSVHAQTTYRFEVNGGFSAGDQEDYDDNGVTRQRRPFTIEPTILEAVQDFDGICFECRLQSNQSFCFKWQNYIHRRYDNNRNCFHKG